MSHRSKLFLIMLGLMVLSTLKAWAQWTTQTINLQPGWNAVFLEVQPEPKESDAVLAGLPVESVWLWNRRFNPVEFIQDPNTLAPPQPDWLVYLAPTNPLASQANLFTIDGGKPYLIKLPDNATPTNWTVTGKAVVRKIEWLSDSLNFVGFNLPATGTQNFQSFFSGSAAHTNQKVYRLSAQGYWQEILATTPMRRGEAFWIRSNGQSDYQGPLNLTLAQRGGLDYGRSLVEQSIKIKNTSTTSKTIQVKKLNSTNAPTGVIPALAGQVPLNYWKFDVVNNVAGWQPLLATLSTTLAPGQEWDVRLEVKRTQMDSPSGIAEALYQSILEISDSGNNTRLTVPITAEGMKQSGVGTPHRRAGLWVGSAEITHVNQPSSTNPNMPMPVAASFPFRILLHVDGTGQTKLLQKVLQMWKQGTYRTNESGIKEVDQPGRFVLVTDDKLIPNFTGAALRDGEPVARRFSSAAFGFRGPILMTPVGEFGANNSQFSCSVVLDYDDPLNPFKHTFHPDHDNMDARYEQKLPEGRESFKVTRNVQLEFTDIDPDNLSLAGWGDTQLGGVYRETITGLHKNPLNLQGAFRLQQAARVTTLND